MTDKGIRLTITLGQPQRTMGRGSLELPYPGNEVKMVFEGNEQKPDVEVGAMISFCILFDSDADIQELHRPALTVVEESETCGCGQPLHHRGMCRFRWDNNKVKVGTAE
jgi:hypothetical protein